MFYCTWFFVFVSVICKWKVVNVRGLSLVKVFITFPHFQHWPQKKSMQNVENRWMDFLWVFICDAILIAIPDMRHVTSGAEMRGRRGDTVMWWPDNDNTMPCVMCHPHTLWRQKLIFRRKERSQLLAPSWAQGVTSFRLRSLSIWSQVSLSLLPRTDGT